MADKRLLGTPLRVSDRDRGLCEFDWMSVSISVTAATTSDEPCTIMGHWPEVTIDGPC